MGYKVGSKVLVESIVTGSSQLWIEELDGAALTDLYIKSCQFPVSVNSCCRMLLL